MGSGLPSEPMPAVPPGVFATGQGSGAVEPSSPPARASRAVAQLGLVSALALMTLCLMILIFGALDGRQYRPDSPSLAASSTPPAQHLQAVANR